MRLFSSIVLFFLTTLSSAQLSEEAQISILTSRSGDDIYNMFGHTAIRITDPTKRKDEVYNYGLFSFKEPNFTMKFLRGKLLYHLGKTSYLNFMKDYAYEKRSVFEQKLDLDMVEKNKIYAALLENIKPANSRYHYDFFYDNCCTRLRDQFIKNFQGISFPQKSLGDLSYRQLLDESTYRKPWIDFGMDLLVGTRSDVRAGVIGEMYLPFFFFNHLEETTVQGDNLVSETNLILDFEKEEAARDRNPIFNPVLFFSFFLLLEFWLFFKVYKTKSASSMIKYYDKLWYFFLFLGGIILIFMWFWTDHHSTKWNYNLLWLNPLFLWLVIKPSSKMGNIFLFIFLILAILSATFVQQLHGASLLIIAILLLKLVRQRLSLFQSNHAILA